MEGCRTASTGIFILLMFSVAVCFQYCASSLNDWVVSDSSCWY